MRSISEIGEHHLIRRIRERAGDPPSWVTIGIGDDAAVVEPARGELDVITTDCQIEDVHFSRAWMSMREIGAKALAVNISDLAAMAAAPRAATLSLALPPALLVDDFDAMIDGFLDLSRLAKVPLVGGNISRSPGPIVIDVTLIGSARRRRILTRSGGAAGHLLFVTGSLGAAAARIERFEDTNTQGSYERSEGSYERPVFLLNLAREVAANRLASACMDLSDGLADGVSQMATASGTGAVVLSSKVPVDPTATLEHALRGGEDYELLFAVPPRRRRGFEKIAGRSTTVTCVGEMTKAPDLLLDEGPLGGGFAHF
ncbi:MAG: thiamine-phosphate kinase [Acidobacteria bacterium]|nr:MAG: thiamine-phosphate kinase [Acidobacteriota bacterium]